MQDRVELIKKKFNLTKEYFVVFLTGGQVWDKGVVDVVYAAKRLLMDIEPIDKSTKFVFGWCGTRREKNEVVIAYYKTSWLFFIFMEGMI